MPTSSICQRDQLELSHAVVFKLAAEVWQSADSANFAKSAQKCHMEGIL